MAETGEGVAVHSVADVPEKTTVPDMAEATPLFQVTAEVADSFSGCSVPGTIMQACIVNLNGGSGS